MKKVIYKISTLILILVLCLSIGGCSLFESEKGDISKLPDSMSESNNITFQTQDESTRTLLSRPDAVEMVARSVVAIKMEINIDMKVATSYGSGVIIDANTKNPNEYYILTCHHVIASGGNITVYVPDDNSRNIGDDDYNNDYIFTGEINSFKKAGDVTLIGGDQDGDIAVLRLNTGRKNVKIVTSKLPVNDYNIRQGEDVFAVGNPSGTLPMSVCAGVVSYLDRVSLMGKVGYMTLMQIDLPINHGSSGGGLFNMYGELVGITNGGSDEYNSLNYSIPYYGDNGFISLAKQLIATETRDNFGFVTGRWQLGINIRERSGVEVTNVVEGSNAENSGLKRGDRIVGASFVSGGKTYGDEDINNVNDFSMFIYQAKKYLSLGDKITLKVQSGYEIKEIIINLTKQFIFCDTLRYPE